MTAVSGAPTHIRFNPALIGRLTAELTQASKVIAGHLDDLESASAQLQSQWSGEARDAYAVAQAEWHRSLRRMAAVLDRANAATLAASERYAAAQTKVQSRWR